MLKYEIEELINDYANLKISRKKLINQISFEEYVKYSSKINRAEEYRSMTVKDRNLEVVYIHGSSGSGKTTLAKYLSEQLGFDYFVSGSGDDILDSYDKEECIILDDFRAGSMKFMEVLKFLDNNTNSSVKSRYNNKDISNCKIIFITTVIKPSELYKSFSSDEGVNEPAKQFYRRIGNYYYEIFEDGSINKLSAETGATLGLTIGNMNDIFKKLGINPKANTKKSLLEKFETTTNALPKGLVEVQSTIDDIF